MKNKINIQKGNKFLWRKILYEIIDINDLNFILSKIDDNKIYRISREDFYEEYRLNFIIPYNNDPEFYNVDLNTLDDKKKEKAVKITKYLNKIKNCSDEDLDYTIKKVAEEINDPRPPSISTIYRWKKKYIINNKIDLRLIVSKQIRNQKIHEEVEKIIKNCINDYYLDKTKISIRGLQRIINKRIYEKNIKDKINLKEPSYETIRQYVYSIDKMKIVQKRDGSIEALKQYKTYKQGLRASRILEYIEVDHLFMKIEVNYEDEYLGQPVLTLLIDNYSLSILGVFIGFGHPNTKCIINALKSVYLPKEFINEAVVQTSSRWIQFGCIENLIADNASEFHSNDLENICIELGVNLQYAPPYHPWYKKYVESFFGALDDKLISSLPGSDKNNESESISYDTFLKVFYTYIIDIYHNSYIDKKHGTPYDLWKKSLKDNPIPLTFSYDEINIIISMTVERTISKMGISIDNIYYNDENLNFIRRNSLNTLKVKIKRNWEDISYIYVFSNFANKYIKVYAVDQEYTKNKTIFQHHCILKLARKESKNLDSKAKIYNAYEHIENYINTPKEIKRKLKIKNKILNYKNISSKTFKEESDNNLKNKNQIQNYINIHDLDEIIDDNEDWSVFHRDK